MGSEARRLWSVGMLLFEGFELLDVAGPLEVFGRLPEHFALDLFAEAAGPVRSAQGPALTADYSFTDCPPLDLLVVPGGVGARREVENASLLAMLRYRAAEAELTMSVCTGSALLARAGVLDGRRATSNKRSFDWVASQSEAVEWVRRARWVEDGAVVTSSGIAAGIDAAFAIVGRLLGDSVRDELASVIEYQPWADPHDDPFAREPAAPPEP